MSAILLPGSLTMEQGSAPPTPPSGSTVLYVKSDGLIYYKDDAGVEHTTDGALDVSDEIGGSIVSASGLIVPHGTLIDAGGGVAELAFLPRPDRRKWIGIFSSAASYGVQGITPANLTVTPTASSLAATDGNFTNHATSTVLGNISGFISGAFTLLRLGHSPYGCCLLKTGSLVTAMRMFVGWFNSAPTNADAPPNNSMGFRYSSVVPDPGIVGFVRDGTTTQVTGNLIPAGAAITATTPYLLEWYKTGTTAFFRIGGTGAWTSLTSNLPADTVDLGLAGRIITTTAAQRNLAFSRFYTETD